MGIEILFCCTYKTQNFHQKKTALTLIEMQQLPDSEKNDSTIEFSCLKWTACIVRRKVCAKYQKDTDELKMPVTTTEQTFI